ncbi:hypothetical protein Palpr_1460 [Paludibacter propionicigenes WB4]|uniref:Uncharacterized protein n=1 Tax=Paludibacter propionicigenes (strain DSM 17365 / JCM 13257 / WB4) TaxID=694427 RepID=E4T4G2_PALPW|nr:hypothetical protein Palpr_1460 [Paludibacter propionicigenes WB4]
MTYYSSCTEAKNLSFMYVTIEQKEEFEKTYFIYEIFIVSVIQCFCFCLVFKEI